MAKKSDLFSIAEEWAEKLRNCSYAGEIYLDLEQLESLAGEFRRNIFTEDSIYEVAVLVLAVNCAYHHYDDRGFWLHFCRILDIEKTSAVQERFGRIFEKRLKMLGLSKTERAGPFRYVGAILEQCGVSKRYITPLADIIKTLKGVKPWNALLSTGQKEFQRRLDMLYCSHYLKDFLKDKAGWEFTMQICQLLMFCEQGELTIDDLRELPGYQPGFWDEFLVHFYGSKPGRSSDRVSTPLKPRLIFVPGERCVAIRFPGPEYANGVKNPAFSGFWQYPFTVLDQDRVWSDYYSGLIPGPSGHKIEWVLSGWIPDGMPVLFHPVSGFVQRGRRISPGKYWLLVSDNYHLAGRIISEAGQVLLPGNIGYRAFLVQLEPDDDIPGYESEADPDTDVVLGWVDPERHRLWCGELWPDIFLGSLPELNVSNFEPVEERRVAIFYVAGSVSGRVRNRRELEMVLSEINSMAPVAGRFYACAIGRTGRANYGSVLSEIDFCLIPPVNIKFTRRLYDFNEEPTVEIDDSFSGRLQLECCRCNDRSGRRWIIPSSVDRVNGTLECNGITINIRIPVYRARMYYSDGKPVRYLFLNELKQETTFFLTGYPDSEAFLGCGDSPDAKTQVKFKSDGLVEIPSARLKELFYGSGFSICEITLTPVKHTQNEHIAATGAMMINLETAYDGIVAGTGCRTSVYTPGNLIKIMDMCTELCRGVKKGQCYNLNRFPCFHPVLDEWIFSIFACASVFDGVIILVSNKRIDWTGQIKNERLNRLLNYILQTLEGISPGGKPPAGGKVVPPVERWEAAVGKFYQLCTAGEDLPDFADWTEEILRHQKKFRSNIARLPGGHNLSAAWVCYHRGMYKKALALLTRTKKGHSVLSELRDILLVLLSLRLARLQFAEKVIEASQSAGILQPVFTFLKQIVKSLKGMETGPMTVLHTEILNSLPLRTEDRVLFETARGKSVEGAKSDSVIMQDWLLLWFFINFCKNLKHRSVLIEKLLSLEEIIPPSPDKQKIIERLKKLSEVK